MPSDGSSPLTGAFDLHVHAAPDVVERKMNDLQLVAASAEAGMRGFLLKSHHGSTVERAYLLNAIEPRTWIAGGLTLNDAVGGFNPAAVETALKLGGRCIWMPTQSSANHKRKKGKPGPGLSVLAEDGKLLPVVHEILALIAANNVLLATGHLETREVLALARAAKKAGVDRILISHVELDEIAMPTEVQLELARLGCYIEHSLICIHPIGGAIDFSEIVANIRVVGPERCVITTDYGQPEQPEPPTGMATFMTMLRRRGFEAEEIARMSSATPRELVGSA